MEKSSSCGGGQRVHLSLYNKMRRGVASVPEKVITSGVGRSTSNDNNDTFLSLLSSNIQTSPTLPCPSRTVDHAGLPPELSVTDGSSVMMYTTPVGPSTNGTGQAADSPGRPTQAKRRLELEVGDPLHLQDDGRTSKRPAESQALRAAKSRGLAQPKSKSSPDKARSDTSLGLMTRKFLQLLARSIDGVVDLNVVARELNVQKRRLYDITNVLEGVRLIKKKSKNNIQWMGRRLNVEADGPLDQEVEKLCDEERRLDEMILSCRRQVIQMSEDINTNKFAYLTYEDVKKMPSLKEQTVIVIRAPAETKMEVPHPDESLQVYLSSTQGPIEVFLCSDDHVPSSGGLTNGNHRSLSTNGKGSISSSSTFVKVESQDEADRSTTCRSGIISNGTSSSLYRLPESSSFSPRLPPGSLAPVPRPEDQQTFVTLAPSSLAPSPLNLSLEGEDYILSLGEDEGITDLFSTVDLDCLNCLPLELPLI